MSEGLFDSPSNQLYKPCRLHLEFGPKDAYEEPYHSRVSGLTGQETHRLPCGSESKN